MVTTESGRPREERVPLVLDVCIVLYNTEVELVEECLASIETASTVISPHSVRVSIVDNSSSDRLRNRFESRVSSWRASAANGGFSKGANAAMKAGSGNVVLFLNPDARIGGDTLRILIEAVQVRPDALYCCWLHNEKGVQVDAFMHWWSSSGRLLRRNSYRRMLESVESGSIVRVQKVSGGALFASRDLLEQLGPFNEGFFLYGEDADLSQRARAQGTALLAIRDAAVSHIGASSQVSYSGLVERARVDAALRLASYHLGPVANFCVRVDLWIISLIGLLPGLGGSSGSKRARYGRFREMRRWGMRRVVDRFDPEQ